MWPLVGWAPGPLDKIQQCIVVSALQGQGLPTGRKGTKRVPVRGQSCSLQPPLYSGCPVGRRRPQCTSKPRMERQSCHSCTLPSPTLAGSHHVRARPSSVSSRSKFSGTEQLQALPKGVCSRKMRSLRPSNPYNLSLRCVPRDWEMTGRVDSRSWDVGRAHGAEGPTGSVSSCPVCATGT